jgi:hypothetical protein
MIPAVYACCAITRVLAKHFPLLLRTSGLHFTVKLALALLAGVTADKPTFELFFGSE